MEKKRQASAWPHSWFSTRIFIQSASLRHCCRGWDSFMYSYFLNAFSASFIVFVTLFKRKEAYLISQNALKGPVKVRSSLFWNKNADIYPKFQKRSSLFGWFCVYRDCNSWSIENRIHLQLYYEVNTHQHWLELRGEDGSADGLWSSTYEVVTVSGSKFSRAVALFAACLLTPLSLDTVLSEPQDDPLGPRCSSTAALAPLQPQSRWPSVRGAHNCSRPSSRWLTSRRRGGRLGTQLNQGGLGVSRWLLWLSPGADGRPWWSVSAPLSLRWVSRWETFSFCLLMSSLVANVRFSCSAWPNRTWIWFLSSLERSAAERQRFWDLLPWRSQSILRLPAPDLLQTWMRRDLCVSMHVGRHPGPGFVGTLRNMTHIWCYAFPRARSSSSPWLPDARAWRM